jgi:transposase
VPHGHWQTTTFLAGLRNDRVVAPLVLEGAIGGVSFLAWVEQFLAPRWRTATSCRPTISAATRWPGRAKAIACGASLMLLPSYSPDLNRIEQLFAKIKSVIRALAPCSREALFHAIAHGLRQVSPTECTNYLVNKGYRQLA